MLRNQDPLATVIDGLDLSGPCAFLRADTFPTIRPVHWLTSHFAVGGYSPLRRLSGMLTAHMTEIAPRNGFTWHPHRGLEIYTVVISGELYHEDSTGGRGFIRAGEVQRMFSGDYILHQELNLSGDPVQVIQIWFVASGEHRGLPPHYEQVSLRNMPSRRVGDATAVDIIGADGATDAHVDARLVNVRVPASGQTAVEAPNPGEELFLYATAGSGSLATDGLRADVAPFDVLVARPVAPPARLTAGPDGLAYLAFYLSPFLPASQTTEKAIS